MYLKVFRNDIIEGVSKSVSLIPAKTGAAFLRTLWLKAEDGVLRVLSTDSSLEFTGGYAANIEEPGLVGVQGRNFHDLMRKLPSGEITLKVDPKSSTLQVSQGSRRYKLPTSEQSWFQDFAQFPDAEPAIWSGDFLQEIIDRVLYCVSDEDTMEAMACMYFRPFKEESKVEVCGLNGHQFAMVSFVNEDIANLLPEEGILVQKKYLFELRKWLSGDEIELAISQKRLYFRTADKRETFSLPLSNYIFPDYKNFISKVQTPDASNLEVDRAELSDALDRLAIFNSDSNRCTYFVFQSQTQMQLQSQGQETGAADEALEVKFSGELGKIAFPTRDVLEILSHLRSANVRFTLTGSEGACGISGEDDSDYLVIIMPMKIVDETYYSEENI